MDREHILAWTAVTVVLVLAALGAGMALGMFLEH